MNKNIQINCLFCEKIRCEGYLHFPQLLRSALFLKYNLVDDQPFDELFKRAHKQWVVNFYEKTQDLIGEELLKRVYKNTEIQNKLEDLTEYYKYRIESPRLFMIPISLVLNNYIKQRKEYHYASIKYQLGLMVPTSKIKTDIPFNQLLQITISDQDQSQSIISILNKLNPKFKYDQKIQFNLNKRISTQQSGEIKKQQLISHHDQIQKRLKAILNVEQKSPQKKLISYQYHNKPKLKTQSVSNVKYNTIHNNNICSVYSTQKKKSLQNIYSVQSQQKLKTLSKFSSQADVATTIYTQNQKNRQTRKLMQIFNK